MSRTLLALAILAPLSLALPRVSFAVGGSLAGRGNASTSPAGIGSAAGGYISSLGHNYSTTGGLSLGNHSSTPQTRGASTDNNHLTTGGKAPEAGAKGNARTSSASTNHVNKNVGGVGNASETPGGRGF